MVVVGFTITMMNVTHVARIVEVSSWRSQTP